MNPDASEPEKPQSIGHESLTDVWNDTASGAPTESLNESVITQDQPVSSTELIRRKLGRFQLIRRLGQGGYGIVFLAHDPDLDRHVALKVPRAGMLVDEDDVQRFLREARAAAQLQHPHIVQVFEVGKHGDTHYIASALVEGSTLRDRIKRGPKFGRNEVAHLVAQLANALHYAHGQGIIHRDIKPANIMISQNGQPQIMDFGLARRQAGDVLRTQEGTRLGTLAYMSPEQASGKSHLADARSDVWSLGVTLYEMLTGHRPFPGDAPQEVLQDILDHEPLQPRALDKSIPKDLETICLKCLEKDPDRRYASADQLADDLERWSSLKPIRARAVGPIGRTSRWIKRNVVVTVLSAIVFLVLAVGLAVSVYLTMKWRDEAVFSRAETVRANQERDAAIAAEAAEESARRRYQLRLAENQLNQAIVECQQGRIDRGVLWMARALQNVPSKPGDLEEIIRRNLAAWSIRMHQLESVFECYSAAFSADSLTLATTDRSGLRLWDIATGKPKTNPLAIPPSTALIFSGDGTAVFSAHKGSAARQGRRPENGQILRWSVGNGRRTDTIAGRSPLDKVFFSSDRNCAVTVRQSPEPQQRDTSIFENRAAKCEIQVWDLRSRTAKMRIDENGKVGHVVICPHSKFLALQLDEPKVIKLYEVGTAASLKSEIRNEADSTVRVAFSPNSKFLAVQLNEPNVVRLYEIDTGESLKMEINDSGNFLFDYDSRVLVTNLSRPAFWNTRTGEPVPIPRYASHLLKYKTVASHMSFPDSQSIVSFNPNGRTILTRADLDHFLLMDRTGEPIGQPLAARSMSLSDDWKRAVIRRPYRNASLGRIVNMTRLDGQPDFLWLWRLAANTEEARNDQAVHTDHRSPNFATESSERIMLWTQIATGMELTTNEQFSVLKAENWMDLRSQYADSDLNATQQ